MLAIVIRRPALWLRQRTVRRDSGAEGAAWVEWALVAAAGPLLLTSGQWTIGGLALIAAAWLAHRRVAGRWTVVPPVNRPILLLLTMLLVALIPSVRPDYSAPKLWGTLYGLAICCAALSTCRSTAAARRAAAILLVVGALAGVVGVLYMAEPQGKLFNTDLYSLLPRLDRRIQSSTIAIWGINANQVGGTLTLFAPLAVGLARERGILRWVALMTGACIVSALVLSQSRGSLAGVSIALWLGLIWRGGWRARALAVGLAALAPLALLVGWEAGGSRMTESAIQSIVGRFELWQRSLAMIADMPFSGIGLNTFPVVVEAFYPGYASGQYFDPTSALPHAHSFLLQTGVDFGVFGLAAIVWLVALAVRGGLHASRQEGADHIALGLLLGLLAHLVFGLTDAVAIGSKPGPALWASLGLLIAVGHSTSASVQPRPCPRFTVRSWSRRPELLSAGLVVAALALVAPATLNLALLALHRPQSFDERRATVAQLALDTGQRFAWGPYGGRFEAARALLARSRGDLHAEIAALETAAAACPWDPSLAVLLDEARLIHGDFGPPTAQADRTHLVEALVRRGRMTPPNIALDALARARETDPRDARPYVAAAEVLIQGQRYDEAARLLAAALRLRDPSPWLIALGNRLSDSASPLPALDAVDIGYFRDNAVLAARAAVVLDARSDPEGARYAQRLADLMSRSATNP